MGNDNKDGWELAQNIAKLSVEEREECFNCKSLPTILVSLPYEKANVLYEKYKETHKFGSIDPGDEIIIDSPLLVDVVRGLVLWMTRDYIYILPSEASKREGMEPVLKLMLNVIGVKIEKTGYHAYVIEEYR